MQQTTETLDLKSMEALLDRTGTEEQHAGDETVGDHAKQCGVDAIGGERGDTQHHITHVGDRRKRDESLHVFLRQTTKCPVNDADRSENANHWRP